MKNLFYVVTIGLLVTLNTSAFASEGAKLKGIHDHYSGSAMIEGHLFKVDLSTGSIDAQRHSGVLSLALDETDPLVIKYNVENVRFVGTKPAIRVVFENQNTHPALNCDVASDYSLSCTQEKMIERVSER